MTSEQKWKIFKSLRWVIFTVLLTLLLMKTVSCTKEIKKVNDTKDKVIEIVDDIEPASMAEEAGRFIKDVKINFEKGYYVNDDFAGMDNETLYKVWEETAIGTEVRQDVFNELKARGYWDEEWKEDEKRALEILEKYKNK